MGRPLIAVDARYGLRSPRRGVGEYVSQVYRALAEMPRAYDIVLYADTSADLEVVKEFQTAYRVRVLAAHPFAIWEQYAWPCALRQDRAQVTHGTANIGPLAWRGRLVLTIHDVIEWHRGKDFPSSIPLRHHCSRLYRMNALKPLVKRADAILTVSEHASGDIADVLDVSRKRIRVTPLASKVRMFELVSAKDNYFLVLGALDPRKNLEGAIAGFARANLADCRLKIVGLEPNAVSVAKAMIGRYQIEGRVDLATMVSDIELKNLYSKALGFIYLSFYEGFGLPVLEAMALGCPVVASNRSAVAEISKEAAVVVSPTDTEAVASALHRLATNTELRRALVERGLSRARSFSWAQTAEATHMTFEEVLGKHQ